MNPREKKLLIVIVAFAVVAFCAKVIYPKWVEPMFRYDDKIGQLKAECDALEFDLSRMEHARETYREYVYRTGGTNTEDVGDLFKFELKGLMEQCRLSDVNVSSKANRPVGLNEHDRIAQLV